jgi:hypothetical protein
MASSGQMFQVAATSCQAKKENCWKAEEEKNFILLGEDRESHKTIKV